MEISADKRKAFLVLFTLQLILNSKDKFEQLEQIVSSEAKEKIHLKQTEPKKEVPKAQETEIKKEGGNFMKSVLSQNPPPRIQKPQIKEEKKEVVKPVELKTPRVEIIKSPRTPSKMLRIPEPRLPPEFQYLKPVPVARDIDLGKLNPLIYDRGVQTIECSGPDRPLVVSGAMGRKPSKISLSNDEVGDIVQRFSSASRIPTDIGVYRVVVGRLIFSAVISDVVPPKFTIRKMHTNAPQASPYRKVVNPSYGMFFKK